MSKITFRADDDLIDQLEERDASKSEIMRDALRTYLDGTQESDSPQEGETVDSVLSARVDKLIEERLGSNSDSVKTQPPTAGIDLTVTLEGSAVEDADTTVDGQVESVDQSDKHTSRTPRDPSESTVTEAVTCGSCGTELNDSDIYCSNCGEKTSHRVFCECGDEIRSDWSFCPECGRRTPAADVLDD